MDNATYQNLVAMLTDYYHKVERGEISLSEE